MLMEVDFVFTCGKRVGCAWCGKRHVGDGDVRVPLGAGFAQGKRAKGLRTLMWLSTNANGVDAWQRHRAFVFCVVVLDGSVASLCSLD